MLDHLIYAVPNLADAVAWFTTRAGVRPTPGGRHVGLGTRNELVALGDGAYLEIIGPDIEQPEPEHPRPFGIDLLVGPRLVTWAARSSDIDAHVAAARATGYDPGDPIALSRTRPDGVVLQWKLTSAGDAGGDGLVPFLIDWGATPHPSETAAEGVRLVSFGGEHPDPDPVRRMLGALGVELDVQAGVVPRLTAELETPEGTLTLR